MIAIGWLVTLSLSAQIPTNTSWRIPVPITVLQDVPVEPHPQDMHRQKRGVIYINPKEKGFVIKKGQTFQMTKIGQEGGCSIGFAKKEYELSTCPWLDGFRDHQTDIFSVPLK